MIKIRFKKPKKASGKAKIYENTSKSTLKEASEDELEHIEAARLLEPEDLAFSELFGDKRRIIIDFEQLGDDTELGKFVKMFQTMGYDVNWEKGTLMAVRQLTKSSPESLAAMIMSNDFTEPRPRKIHMKIGKWLKKTSDYVLKLDALTEKVMEHHQGDIEYVRITGENVKAGLTEQETEAYYRNYDLLHMMVAPMTQHFRNRPYELPNLATWWQQNAGSIKKEIEGAKHNEDVIIITRHPLDVFRMSDFKNIESCHSPPSRQGGHMSQQYKCAVAEAHGHGAVAYVVDKQELLDEYGVNTLEGVERQIQDADHEIFYDDERVNDGPVEPKYRVRLRQMRYYDDNDALNASIGQGTEIAVPERRMYPEGLPGFVERILKWAREEQQDVMASVPREGDALNMGRFIKFGGSYEDNAASVLLADLFAQQFDEFVNDPIQDTDTEDELESTLNLNIGRVIQENVNRIQERFNSRYQYCQVAGIVAIEPDDEPVIIITARMRFEWPEEEWNSLPNPTSLRYVVDEINELVHLPRPDGTWTSGWVNDDEARINELWGNIIAAVSLDPEKMIGPDGEWIDMITTGADGFSDFCSELLRIDRAQGPVVKQIIERHYMREGHIKGGAMLQLGINIENGEYRWSDWGSEAHGDEHDGYDSIEAAMTISIPNVGQIRRPTWQPERGTQDFDQWVVEFSRAINIEARKRLMAGPREAVGTQFYLPSQIKFVSNPRENEVYIKWQIELPYDADDEMVALMIEMLENVTEEEVTAVFESVVNSLLDSMEITEMKKKDPNWTYRRWKNNFI